MNAQPAAASNIFRADDSQTFFHFTALTHVLPFLKFVYTTIVLLDREVTNGYTASCDLEEFQKQLWL